MRELPPDIVELVPQYRGYYYTIVCDEIILVELRTRRSSRSFTDRAPKAPAVVPNGQQEAARGPRQGSISIRRSGSFGSTRSSTDQGSTGRSESGLVSAFRGGSTRMNSPRR